MGDLVPECTCAFLKDVAVSVRRGYVLEREDERHLDRLALPIHLISGSENRMFVPESTARTHALLRSVNGDAYYTRTVFDRFGHLDCFLSQEAERAIWPQLAASLG